MPPWYIKAAIQGTLSQLPGAQRYNRLFQRYVTRSLTLTDAYFLQKWRQAERHLATAQHHLQAPPKSCLELGTGWFPIVPIGLSLGGCSKVYTVDTQRLIDKDRVVEVLRYYRRMLATGAVVLPNSERRVDQLLGVAANTTAEQLLEQAGVHSLVADARRLPLADGHLEMICSNNTLEHIPRDVLSGILAEFHRVLSSRGVMSHHIDLADHYANFDSRITVYNFLRFSERRWRYFNNALQYQNRLRINDYRQLHGDAGFRLIDEDSQRRPREELLRVRLAPEFRNQATDDLLVFDTWLVSRHAT